MCGLARRSPASFSQLLLWWLRQLCADALSLCEAWATEPEWPLLLVGKALFASFLVHWMGFRLALHRVGWPEPIFAETTWEGRTGWRKPLVFGISNAMVFVSLRQALFAQSRVPRSLVAHLAAWSTAVEVGVITLQAWRGVPSHFNTSTLADASLYAVKLAGAAALSVSCVAATVGVLRGPTRCSPARRAALCHGLLLLCLSIVVGVLQVAYGHAERPAKAEEEAPCFFATANVTGSACYEIHGKATVKLAHFLPLHVTEVLLLLAWAVDKTPRGVSGRSLVEIAAVGCWALALVGLWITWVGEDIKHPRPTVAVMVLLPLAGISTPFIVTFLAPFGKCAP